MKRPHFLFFLGITLLAGCGRPEGSSRTVIQNKGSDTLVNVAQAWAEAYQTVNPGIAVAVTGGGTGTGIASLLNGTVDIANASRNIKDSERAILVENGHSPVEFVVGFDALAIFLHKDNPIQEITVEQLKAIYVDGGELERWSQLGVTVPGCSSDKIIRISRQNNAGTYAYFREAVLDDQDFKLGSLDMHGSKDVVDLVMNTPCAIGYSGLAYANEEIHMPAVSSEGGATFVKPTVESAVDGSYPIARSLLMYTADEPEGPVAAFLDWILSDEGQCIMKDKGYATARPVECPADAGM
ncbi:MAG: phosphate ABC transporter substrate-binding protein [Bacteroidetes bacterium]|nr:phosphate ABC transporter substrate-binding protein [Bacteroidota bacterium]MDA0874124.1 phosphate ABC transporter substrate-binding protein [Bacteroidota bacterium]